MPQPNRSLLLFREVLRPREGRKGFYTGRSGRSGMADIVIPPTGTQAGVVAAAMPRLEDVLVARLERLPFSRKHWLVAGVLCTATFFDGYDNLMITSVLPLILAALKVPLASAGLLIAASFWGQLFGSPLAGILAERWGRRRILLVSCGIM